MAVFNLRAYDDHEQIVFCRDVDSGLKAIICVHNTNLGPAVGGCRMWDYNSDEGALIDALRLSRGMTYKNAMAGLKMGGGKSVIIGNSKTMKSEELFRAFGRFVEKLSGKYITAEDVGINPNDMAIVNKETNYVLGLEGKSGDPSPVTAYGVYKGIKAAAKHKFGSDDLNGRKISVQGLGHVGYYLCRHLHEEGAKLFVTDISKESIERVVNEFNATAVGIDDIYGLDVDIYAPCALGAVINDNTLPQIKASVIAGAANNQLAEDRHGDILLSKGILYAPDYVINAGGIINVSFEENYNRDAALTKVDEIYGTLTEVFEASKLSGRPTNVIADELARQRVADAKKK
ncbi:Glu/Leu/Phe/Val family dehydrogenase [Kangiella koreensis]|uniref:Glu/Leu/Phe/Val dehydrogenase dimerisation region n=1 Tax=Kangiella koreensis (strain DSM 16069 / JCM 12317 / KCTC 12182 / SW-125) TaxID=523791 RepID=C7RBB0_KANKD|nr:Glu/Leu/Phe/Val dehydrogenase [Kangiella koreensis]ACV26552.1 Glu/Leu/Phe/Val dehydrogenase dimerisation region [Kangiella koreensis DSM 16069]